MPISATAQASKTCEVGATGTASKTKLSISIVATVCTAGPASPVALHAVRSYTVRCQKVNVLKLMWAERGPEALPQSLGLANFKHIAKKGIIEAVTLDMDTSDVVGVVVDNIRGYLPSGVDTNSLPSLSYSSSKEKKQPDDNLGKRSRRVQAALLLVLHDAVGHGHQRARTSTVVGRGSQAALIDLNRRGSDVGGRCMLAYIGAQSKTQNLKNEEHQHGPRAMINSYKHTFVFLVPLSSSMLYMLALPRRPLNLLLFSFSPARRELRPMALLVWLSLSSMVKRGGGERNGTRKHSNGALAGRCDGWTTARMLKLEMASERGDYAARTPNIVEYIFDHVGEKHLDWMVLTLSRKLFSCVIYRGEEEERTVEKAEERLNGPRTTLATNNCHNPTKSKVAECSVREIFYSRRLGRLLVEANSVSNEVADRPVSFCCNAADASWSFDRHTRRLFLAPDEFDFANTTTTADGPLVMGSWARYSCGSFAFRVVARAPLT
ncbi:hypothetical protein HYPSUDRAFT_54631 [Hypholoma sublateritium FD-334 SS-4]|uniref:Uncharacterized protein n=1 Tax=Hypholoma sublateritium (strain FD-334 SS-4) TaxID=945553 RepID=A0A0D2MH80_HYPSF|nr:hypothetical protein HYPSUDRAFT_54631 [Hypholoma sublateritium FD-334 SS-4]